MSPNNNISNICFSRKQKTEVINNIFITIVSFLIIVAIILLVMHPTKYMNSITSGLDLFFISVLPSLLPFLFLTKLLSSIGATKKISTIFSPITKKLLHLPASASFIMLSSFICGYPLGAKLIGDMVKNNELSPQEAKKILPFATTSGPIFVIGAVGGSMFKDVTLGAIIFAVHIVGSILTGLIINLFLNKKINPTKNYQNTSVTSSFSLEETTISTFNSVLMVAVYVSVFYMFIDMAYDTKILNWLSNGISYIFSFLNINPSFSGPISSGIIEMTRGLKELSILPSRQLKLVFGAGLISFGGISIIMQSLAFLSASKLKASYFVLVKIIQTIITTLLALIFGLIFL